MQLSHHTCRVFGPHSMNQCVLIHKSDSQQPHVMITNDGATLVRLLTQNVPCLQKNTSRDEIQLHQSTIQRRHQLIASLCSSQEYVTGDGTTSLVLLLERLESLIHKNVTILQSLTHVTRWTLREALPRQSLKDIQSSFNTESPLWHQVVHSCFQSKILKQDSSWIINHLLEPARQTLSSFPKKKSHIRLFGLSGATIRDSLFIKGIIFKRGLIYAGRLEPTSPITRILITTDVLEHTHLRENVRLDTNNDSSQLAQMVQVEYDILLKKLNNIVNSGVSLVLSRASIGDAATQYLAEFGICVVGRVDRSHLETLASSLNTHIVSSLLDENSFHIAEIESYREVQLNNTWHCIVELKDPHTVTLLLRGSSQEITAETIRSFDDALGVVDCIDNYPEFVYGGGSVEMHMSLTLEQWEREVRGLSRLPHQSMIPPLPNKLKCENPMAFHILSNALKYIVTVLIQNAGYDVNSTLELLKDAHLNRENGHCFGVGLNVPCEALLHVIEPAQVKVTYIERAVEMACHLSRQASK